MDMYSINNIPASYQAAIASKLPQLDLSTKLSIKTELYKRPAGAYGAGSITGARPNIKSVNN